MNWLMDINSISMIFLSPICEFEIQRNFMELEVLGVLGRANRADVKIMGHRS